MAVLVNPTTGALGRKVSRTVSADGSALFSVKWNRYALNDLAGNKNLRASVTQAADDLLFLTKDTDATPDLPDTGINSYTGATATAGAVTYDDANADSVQKTIDNINGIGVGQKKPGEAGYFTRWRAGLGDFRPGFELDATSGLVVTAANVMLGGESAGLSIKGATAGLAVVAYGVGLGTGRSQSGGGQVYADHFESDYFSDTSGNRFPVRNAGRLRESQPGLSEFSVAITEINADMVATTTKVVNIYDVDDNLLGVFPAAAAAGTIAGISESAPFVGPAGSPLFVECVVDAITTDGPLTVTGEIRIA